MTYQIGNIKIASDELAAGKRVDINCAFWIKRIQDARRNAIKMYAADRDEYGEDIFGDDSIERESFDMYLTDELAAIGVKQID